MDADERAIRALRLPQHLQLVFVGTAVENLALKIRHRLEERGFDEVVDAALGIIWNAVGALAVDAVAVQAAEDECFRWAPDTADEPDSGDLMFGLIAAAHACRVVRRCDVAKGISGVISSCEQAMANYSNHLRPDDRPLAELARADPSEWTRYAEVREEARYLIALLDVLETKEVSPADRATLVKL